MRFWTSIAEYKPDADATRAGSGNGPLLDRFEAGVTRAIFSAVILGCLFGFAPTAIDLLGTPRLRWLRLSRRADDCRLPPLGFECLAKVSVVKDLTETFDPLPLRAGKTRGAVPVGQEFVFANLRCHRC